MIIDWIAEETTETTVKSFLTSKGISKRLLAKLKFQGGEIKVNGESSRVRMPVQDGDHVSITLPKEEPNPYLLASDKELDILYEDDHFLIINKPTGAAAVPSPLYANDTMANRVKGYCERQNYFHQTIHVVNRLDRDTSGVMLFAKHTLAHAHLDALLKTNALYREYVVFVDGVVHDAHGTIDAPIGRESDSIIKRAVIEDGKPSLTEYWVKERFTQATSLKVQLHTGRTHQIRVHFSHINHPLIGETLYKGSSEDVKIDRQALHCGKVTFKHPFTQENMIIEAPLPDDLLELQSQLLEDTQ